MTSDVIKNTQDETKEKEEKSSKLNDSDIYVPRKWEPVKEMDDGDSDY